MSDIRYVTAIDGRLDKDVETAAAWWDTRLRKPECTEEERMAFKHWRDADPAHREAFDQLQSILTLLRDQRGQPELRSLRDSALAAKGRGRKFGLAIAASVALMLAGGGALWLSARTPHGPRLGNDSYLTTVGQRSSVTLPDGSVMELNAKTRVDVSFDERRRRVALLYGQAIFRVSGQAGRPFIVRAGGREIQALGTAFDVRVEHAIVQVTLLEGKVAVRGERALHRTSAPILLTPGEQLVTTKEGATATDQVREIDVAKVTAWREGDIYLEDITLAAAVAEMNKYSAAQIVIGDPVLASLRVNGMFTAGEQQIFATALENYFPIEASIRGDGTIVLRGRKK